MPQPNSDTPAFAAAEPRARIRFYSDCYVFGGAENMLVAILIDGRHRDDLGLALSYRANPAYEKGLRSRVPADVEKTSIKLPSPEIWEGLEGGRRRLVKALAHLVLVRQWFQLWAVCRLAVHFVQTRPDVVHVNNGGFPATASCNAAAVAARIAGVPIVVYSVNGTPRGYRSPLRWADYPLDRLTARCVDCFITGAQSSAVALRRLLRLDDERVRALPNGILTRQPHETREDIRARLRVGLEATVYLLVGRMDGMKGHQTALRAFASLLEGQPEADAVLIFAGAGPEEKELRATVAALGLESRIQFLSVPHDHVWALYCASDVVALPSLHEDFPYSVLEAMAMARPVIGSRVGGIPEQIVDGETGFLVAPQDEEALRAALEKLLLDSDLRERLGRAGRARFDSSFTAEAAVSRYHDLYAELGAAEHGPRTIRRPAGSPL